jgi:hypothetical protein
VGVLEYALSLARDLAHSWPRGPHQYYLCATPPSADIRINKFKYIFHAKEVEFLDYIMGSDRIKMDLKKV